MEITTLGHSPVVENNITLGMVGCFSHDYVHLLCPGVVRRLLYLWIWPLQCHLPGRQVKAVSLDFVPLEYSRKPRSLEEGLKWKASGFRQFYCILGQLFLAVVLLSKCMLQFAFQQTHHSVHFTNALLVSFV